MQTSRILTRDVSQKSIRDKSRDRFEENKKVFDPSLVATDNYGAHSPGKYYNTLEEEKKISKPNLKLESAFKFSF